MATSTPAKAELVRRIAQFAAERPSVLAAHLVADLKLGLPESFKENFALLEFGADHLRRTLRSAAGNGRVSQHRRSRLPTAGPCDFEVAPRTSNR